MESSMLRREWFYLIVALALLPLMITGDSLWMDEGNTSRYAMQPDFHDWLIVLNRDGGGDCQMPLGMFSSWLGGKTLGLAEWQLRAVNVFWGALTLFFMARIGRRLQVPWLPLFFALQPFFWFYTNEARPYAPQITLGAMVLLSLVQFIQERGHGLLWVATFSISSVLLCFATMLAPALIVATLVVGGFIAHRNKWTIERRFFLLMLVGALFVLPLGYYYLETLLRGARGVQMWKVDFRYLIYIAYEISGALGLGPSVVHLRELALKAGGPSVFEIIRQCGLSFTLLGGISLVFFIAIRNRQRDGNQYLLPLFLAFLLEVAILFIVGLLIHKAFWPRHYSAAFPFYVTALALALGPLMVSSSRYYRPISLLLLGLLIASSFGIRFGPEHRKEDYRWASGEALRYVHQGKDVWWCGGGLPAIYYGINFNVREPGQGAVFLLTERNWDGKLPLVCWSYESFPPNDKIKPGVAAESLAPDKIFMTRPDIHDYDGTIRKFMRDNGYHVVESRGSFDEWSR